MISRTKMALKLVREGRTPYAAAKAVAISPSAVYRAIRALAKPRCPTCGQVINVRGNAHLTAAQEVEDEQE